MDRAPDRRISSSRRTLAESVSGLMATLADPTRIAMLGALRRGGANVQQLADALDLPHRSASHHARILYRAGVLDRRREGREVVYSIEDWAASWLVERAESIFDDSVAASDR